MNYGQLKTLIAETAHRADMTANIPGFIEQAENSINQVLRSEKNDLFFAFTEANRNPFGFPPASWTLPDDFLEIRTITFRASVKRQKLLRSANYAEITALRGTGSPGRNAVSAYWLGGENGIEFSPQPPPLDDTFTDGPFLDMVYFNRIAPLVNDADTNPTLTEVPDIYLYGALKYLNVFIQDLEIAQSMNELFVASVEAENEMTRKFFDEGPAQITGASAWI